MIILTSNKYIHIRIIACHNHLNHTHNSKFLHPQISIINNIRCHNLLHNKSQFLYFFHYFPLIFNINSSIYKFTYFKNFLSKKLFFEKKSFFWDLIDSHFHENDRGEIKLFFLILGRRKKGLGPLELKLNFEVKF
ncbi:TPA: hypothetical protein DEG21_01530 [Patescibacteria group bacterium]|nr:hypothetical protein [Candidatus Gracilibacteria bacterium]HBY74571.1 hypothetical protein [Candidatus Gracilibacteria bacterium]